MPLVSSVKKGHSACNIISVSICLGSVVIHLSTAHETIFQIVIPVLT